MLTIKLPTGKLQSLEFLLISAPQIMVMRPKLHASGPIVVTRTVPPGTKDAPEKILDMINCRCEVSECKGDHCKCRSIGCTIFCKFEAGPNCKNPLTQRTMDDTDETDQTDQADVQTVNEEESLI